MSFRNELLGLLPSYGAKKTLVVEEQDIADIIKNISAMHENCRSDYDKISPLFWKGSVKQTARYIWEFLKNNVKYGMEPGTRQSVKTPAAILATGNSHKGGNDCKHFSLFAAGVLDSLKRKGYPVNWFFRYANYRPFKKSPQHVFVIAKDNNGKEYWIDPVLNAFDLRKPFVNAIDKKVTTMALYQISGYHNNEVSGFFGDVGKFIKKVAVGIAMFPARQAFLLLVRSNAKGLATTLHQAILKSPANQKKVREIWKKFEGDSNVLFNAIIKHSKLPKDTPIDWAAWKEAFAAEKRRLTNNAAKKKAGIRGIDYSINGKASVNGNSVFSDKYKGFDFLISGCGNNSIGAAPAIAAILAAAAPIVIAFLQFIKKPAQEILPAAQSAIQDIRASGGYNEPGILQIPNTSGELPPPTSGLAEQLDTEQAVETGGVKQYLPYLLLGGGALYLATRKK